MWNRTGSQGPSPERKGPALEPVAPSVVPGPLREEKSMEKSVATTGKSVFIVGSVIGSEDLSITGQVKGRIELFEHALTIGPTAQVEAQVLAKTVTIFGAVTGNVTATHKIEIRESGSVEGDITAPRIVIAAGAYVRGRVDIHPLTAASKLDAEATRDHFVWPLPEPTNPASGRELRPIAVAV